MIYKMNNISDPLNANLLDILQTDFPLVPRPFDDIAARLSIDADDVIARISKLKEDQIIRQISAIFNSSAIGYQSTLAAFCVEDGCLDGVARCVAAHRYVSHCYTRSSHYNLWFTITVPPEVDIQREVNTLISGSVASSMILPALRVYKIGAFFSMAGKCAPKMISNQTAASVNLMPVQRAAVKVLQKDIPLDYAPFSALARETSMDEPTLLEIANEFLDTGVMRRFAAVLRHNNAGYRANAMVCWGVDSDKIDEIGTMFAGDASVSHCYQRPIHPGWQYSLYTMIHCQSDHELDQKIQELARSSDMREYAILHTVKEYKKSRVIYFDYDS